MTDVVTGKKSDQSGSLGETVKVVIQALVLALVVRTLLFQPFNIPSGSMKETLLVGDYLFVSKFSYGFSRYSLPFGEYLPSFGRVLFQQPQRGDIIVFKKTSDPSVDYIKRLIGLPGDKVQMKGGVLYINGTAVPKEPDGIFIDDDTGFGGSAKIAVYKETLPNGVVHHTLDMVENGPEDNTPEFLVPEGHYFFMGDNRDNSSDSRVPGSGVGFVPEENLVGKAQMIFFSISGDARPWEFWSWPSDLRASRIFSFPK